jgi:hypothetical protein
LKKTFDTLALASGTEKILKSCVLKVGKIKQAQGQRTDNKEVE